MWNKFRQTGLYHCYYEPFHEHLGQSHQPVAGPFSVAMARDLRHPNLDAEYFAEYPRNPDSPVQFFDKGLSYDRYCLDADQADPGLTAYLDFLLHHADKRPVFGFCRSSHRQGWLRRNYSALNIYILRSARQQWESHLSFPHRYFNLCNLMIVGKGHNSRQFKPLDDLCHIPAYNADDVDAEIDFYRNVVMPYVGLETEYLIFYYLWLTSLLEGIRNCDLLLDIELLSESKTTRTIAEEGLNAYGVTLNFDDCSIRRYESSTLPPERMDEIETMVREIVVHSFRDSLPELQPPFIKAGKTLSQESSVLLSNLINEEAGPGIQKQGTVTVSRPADAALGALWQKADVERQTLLDEREALLAERQWMVSERNALLAERDDLLAKREAQFAERHWMASQLEASQVEREALLAERHWMASKRDALLAERDALLSERDALLAEHQALLAEHDTHSRLISEPLWTKLLRRLKFNAENAGVAPRTTRPETTDLVRWTAKTTNTRAFSGRIVFDHLPKTAGSAINVWLAQHLGTGNVTPSNVNGNHRQLIQRYGGLYSVISGHIDFGEGENLDPRYQYMTIFREPVDRVISWLYFVLNNHTQSDLAELYEWTKAFVESDGAQLDENLTGYICNLYVEHFCRIDGSSSVSDEEKVRLALKAVKMYDVVGTFEQMPLFLADVANLIGLPSPESIDRVNATNLRPGIDQIPQALRERIIELNQLDLRLYEEVKAWKAATQNPTQPTEAFRPVQWQKYDLEPNLGPVGQIAPVTAIPPMAAGSTATLVVRISNRGQQAWVSDASHPVNLGYHWLDTEGHMVVFNGTRTALPTGGVPAGQEVVTQMVVVAPPTSGRYVLLLTLVQEQVGWFEEMGDQFQPARCEVNVTAEA